MNREKIFRYIDAHIDEHVAHIQQWVRQKSVSWDNLGMNESAELVADSYCKLGCQEGEILKGRFHPGVWAYHDAGAPVTIHNYCMFDTRTVTVKSGLSRAALGPGPQCRTLSVFPVCAAALSAEGQAEPSTSIW